MKYVLSVSYGNDSIAMMNWAKLNDLPDVTVAYCDTGWAAPGWSERVSDAERLAKGWGFKVVRCKSMGMTDLVRQRKGWPGNGMQFCTTHLKMVPFLEWLDEADPKRESIVVIGKRRAESEARANIPEFIESSEVHGGRKVWHPLYRHTDQERDALIVWIGWKVLPHRSKECSPCVNANRADLQRLTPGEIERVNGLEAEIGKPMFRPQRFGTVGIHGVIHWANHGRDRGLFDQETEDCASLFGCGL